MTLLILSFLAGMLTVLAPCILPLLPVVIGATANRRSRATPYIVISSLALSVIIFTFLLKASTALIMIPTAFWQGLSGTIIALIGFLMIFPAVWERLPLARAAGSANRAVSSGFQRHSFFGDVIIGAALGPVFSTCSPTYFFILASVLPVSFALGTAYLISFALGLALVLLLIALLGQSLIARIRGLADAHGPVKKILGLILLLTGLAIAFGYDKKIETAAIDAGWAAIDLEYNLLQKAENKTQ